MSNRLGEHYNRYTNTRYNEYNSKQYEQNNYNDVYNKDYNVQYSVTNESNITYSEYSYYITVSSKDRDRTVYPNVNRYSVSLPQEFKNITSVELIQAIIPAKNDADAEPYLLLDIDEINDVMISNDRYVSESFAILQPSTPITSGGFMQIDKRIHENTVKQYKTPKANLSKLTISIKDCFGELFNIGSDSTPPTNPDKSIQNTLVFKVVTLEKERSELNNRNVF